MGNLEIVRWIVWGIKLPMKSIHQLYALSRGETPLTFGLSFVSSNWPHGSRHRNSKNYIGLRIAEVTPKINQILVVNDYLRKDGGLVRHPRFVALPESRRFQLYISLRSRDEEAIDKMQLSPFDKREFTVLKILEELKFVDISVIQRFDGKVVVQDGVHRLIAALARDGSFKNVRFFITL